MGRKLQFSSNSVPGKEGHHAQPELCFWNRNRKQPGTNEKGLHRVGKFGTMTKGAVTPLPSWQYSMADILASLYY